MPKQKRSKRVVCISDLHCGHRVGLTPPIWQGRILGTLNINKNDKWVRLQRVLWKHYIDALKRVKPIDILIVNGDAIDGKGDKSGGVEQIRLARDEQATMASYAILESEAPVVRMTYGTRYHTGSNEDWENHVVTKIKELDPGVDIRIGSHEWLEVNNTIFDIKHHVSSSSIPYGRGTSLGKEWLWNALWAEQGLQPRADIYVRSHVHYAFHCGQPNSWYALTTPPLQGMGTSFGARICNGMIDFGIVSFDITESGAWMPIWDIIKVKEQATKAEKL